MTLYVYVCTLEIIMVLLFMAKNHGLESGVLIDIEVIICGLLLLTGMCYEAETCAICSP